MVSSFIITFREVLEAALVIGVIFGYLVKTRQIKYNNIVYLGIVTGIIGSIIGALLFNALAGGFTGQAEQLFEGITMLIGAFLLTTMILWMMKQKQVAKELENKVAAELNEAGKFGLFLLVFIAVLREGVETVIFLKAASFVSADNNMLGALLGIIAAVILGYLIFVGSMKFNIKKFFTVTSIILILFAAGLVSHSVGEFQEAGIIPPVIEHVWDINPPLNSDGSYPLFHQEGYIGSLLHGLFGYTADPSLPEVTLYLIYLVLIFSLWKKIEKIHKITK